MLQLEKLKNAIFEYFRKNNQLKIVPVKHVKYEQNEFGDIQFMKIYFDAILFDNYILEDLKNYCTNKIYFSFKINFEIQKSISDENKISITFKIQTI